MAALTREQRLWRAQGVGASDAEAIMKATPKAWEKLAESKRNPLAEDDGDKALLPMLGHAVEPVCLEWFHRTVEPLMATTIQVEYPAEPYIRCTLDGVTADGIPVEAKFHAMNKTIDEMVQWKWPQLQHQMFVAERDVAFLAVIFGHYGKFETAKVQRDQAWIEQYLLRVFAFREFQETGVFNGEPLAIGEPKVFGAKIHVWEPGDNVVAPAAVDFLDCREPAARYENAKEIIKKALPDDARMATWVRGKDGIKVRRSKSGAVTIEPMVIR